MTRSVLSLSGRRWVETHSATLRRLLPYAFFLALVVVFLWKPIFTGKALLPGDYLAKMSPWNTVIKSPSPEPQWNPLQWDAIAQYYPWRVFYARSMRSGHIPLWNPHQFCGTPFLANGQSAALYPPNLVFLIFDPITAFTILAALHMFLSASFTYLYLRELGCRELGGIIGGICFAFSAFMVLWLELPTFVAVATWLPLILLLIHRSVERKSIFYAMLAGAAMAIAILAGHFQIAFYVIFAAALWWLWKLVSVWREDGQLYAAVRVGALLAVFLVITCLLAAAQVMPTLELAGNSHRAGGPSAAGYDWFQTNALKPYRLITAFAPDFFGNPSKNNYFLLGNLNGHVGGAADYIEYGMYIGILPLMLAVIALWQVFKRRHVGFFAVLGLIAILAAIGAPINAVFYYLIPGFSALGGPNRILLLYIFSTAALAGFGIDRCNEFATNRLRWRKVLVPLIVAVIIADLFAFGINYNPTCDRSKVYPKTHLTDTLKKIAGNSRIAPINPKWSLFETPNAILPPNAAMVYGLYDVQGYDSLYTKAYKDWSSEMQGMDSSPPENGNMALMRDYSPTIGRITRFMVAEQAIDDPNARLIKTVDGVRIYELDGVSRLPPVTKPYRPFSFRFGLFLTLIGVSSLALVGVYRAIKYNSRT